LLIELSGGWHQIQAWRHYSGWMCEPVSACLNQPAGALIVELREKKAAEPIDGFLWIIKY
jgi:hypothetical protein